MPDPFILPVPWLHGWNSSESRSSGFEQNTSSFTPLILPKHFITTDFIIPLMQIQPAPLRWGVGGGNFFFIPPYLNILYSGFHHLPVKSTNFLLNPISLMVGVQFP